jgi:hypothetical protein
MLVYKHAITQHRCGEGINLMAHVIVNIDDAQRVFSTKENVRGRIEITVPNTVTVHNDDIHIAFEGLQP